MANMTPDFTEECHIQINNFQFKKIQKALISSTATLVLNISSDKAWYDWRSDDLGIIRPNLAEVAWVFSTKSSTELNSGLLVGIRKNSCEFEIFCQKYFSTWEFYILGLGLAEQIK